MQIDFGERRALIGDDTLKVYLFVATLGYSRRLYVRAFRNERQESWFAGLEGAFRHFGGVTEEVLFDNDRGLVVRHDRSTREVEFNARLHALARHWRFRPRACAPYRARTTDEVEQSLSRELTPFARRAILRVPAGDRAAKSRVGGESPAAQPSASFLLCGARGHLRTASGPTVDLSPVSDLRLFNSAPFLASGSGNVVFVAGSALAPAGWLPRAELQVAQFFCVQGGAQPGVVFAVPEQVPDDDRELARDRNRGDVVTAPTGDALIKCSQRSRPAHRLPGGLDQHGARMRAALLGDPTVPRSIFAGLMHARVQAEIGDQLVGACEALDRPDRSQHADGDHHVDAGDGHQAFCIRIGQRVAGQLPLDNTQVLAEAIMLAHVPRHRVLLVNRKRLPQ